MNTTPEQIAQSIQPALSSRSDIVAAYFFGSAVRGRLRPFSDIDIAILLDEEAAGKDLGGICEGAQ
jgi:predicted nucleotidyltransferase